MNGENAVREVEAEELEVLSEAEAELSDAVCSLRTVETLGGGSVIERCEAPAWVN